VIRAKALSAGYGAKEILHRLSFEISKGVTAVVGPGGSGKSTLLRMLAGVEGPEDFWVDGQLTKSTGRMQSQKDPTLVDSGDYWERMTSLLSQSTAVIALDEPHPPRDEVMINRIARLISDRSHDDFVIFSSHHLGFIRKCADRVILLVDGLLIESADVESFFEQPQNERTRRFVHWGS